MISGEDMIFLVFKANLRNFAEVYTAFSSGLDSQFGVDAAAEALLSRARRNPRSMQLIVALCSQNADPGADPSIPNADAESCGGYFALAMCLEHKSEELIVRGEGSTGIGRFLAQLERKGIIRELAFNRCVHQMIANPCHGNLDALAAVVVLGASMERDTKTFLDHFDIRARLNEANYQYLRHALVREGGRADEESSVSDEASVVEAEVSVSDDASSDSESESGLDGTINSGDSTKNNGEDKTGSVFTIRVASYNVLSPSLFKNPHRAKALENNTRLKVVQEKIKEEMRRNAVICLQEMTRLWMQRLLPIFEAADYGTVQGLYGYAANGYMGVILAWPRRRFDLIEALTQGVADSVCWDQVALSPVWREVQKRENCAVGALLKEKTRSSRQISVVTYHMPCLYGTDEKCQVMVAHAAMLMQIAQKFAKGGPLIVAGDFNAKPDSSIYQLLTDGGLPDFHPQLPPQPFPCSFFDTREKWRISGTFRPMRSAYGTALGKSPNLQTLLSRTMGRQTFSRPPSITFFSPIIGLIHRVRTFWHSGDRPMLLTASTLFRLS
jgi:hypothetical protein